MTIRDQARHSLGLLNPSPVFLRSNWQQYLADLMIRIAESIDDDDRLRRVARLIDFHHFDELQVFFDSCRERPPAEEYERRKARFLEAIPA